jgi:uncharacterized protein
MVFIDTSAFLSLLGDDEEHHRVAVECWRKLLASDRKLITTNYVLLETISLVQRRLGIEAVRLFQESIEPVLAVVWVDENCHYAALAALQTDRRRRCSLVDQSSFVVMRERGITEVFAFDRHFREQGFTCLR